jgi:hypothetical protein
MSLYANDVVVFIKPDAEEWGITNVILQIFAQAAGLITNVSKTDFYPIMCHEADLSFLSATNIDISSFPYKYLGLPLHFKNSIGIFCIPLFRK